MEKNMNDTLRTIFNRRSIRRFKPEQFPREELEHIVQAGLHAPSARNRQPWHFAVLRGQPVIARLNAEVKAATARMPDNPYADMIRNENYTINYHAPTFVIVSADPRISPLASADCALALGSMFLAACSLGIGSCWINQICPLSDEPGFRKVMDGLGIPSGYRIYGCGAFGYATDAHAATPPRREGTVTYVRRDSPFCERDR